MVLTVIFGISLVGIVLLFLFKIIELKSKRQLFLSRTLSRFDEPISKNLGIGLTKYEKGKHVTSTFLFDELPNKTKHLYHHSKNAIKGKYATMLPNVRGNRVLKQNGNVSSFLVDIAKNKEENGGGRIEE